MSLEAMSGLQERMVQDVAMLTGSGFEGGVLVERLVERNGVSDGRNAGSFQRWVSWVLVFLVLRCLAGVPNGLASSLKCLMIGR